MTSQYSLDYLPPLTPGRPAGPRIIFYWLSFHCLCESSKEEKQSCLDVDFASCASCDSINWFQFNLIASKWLHPKQQGQHTSPLQMLIYLKLLPDWQCPRPLPVGTWYLELSPGVSVLSHLSVLGTQGAVPSLCSWLCDLWHLKSLRFRQEIKQCPWKCLIKDTTWGVFLVQLIVIENETKIQSCKVGEPPTYLFNMLCSLTFDFASNILLSSSPPSLGVVVTSLPLCLNQVHRFSAHIALLASIIALTAPCSSCWFAVCNPSGLQHKPSWL